MSLTHGYAASDAKGTLKPFEFDLGELGPEEVEIKVTHCGICHSDISMLDNEWGMSKFPFVPGHEAVGTVVAPWGTKPKAWKSDSVSALAGQPIVVSRVTNVSRATTSLRP
jgi:D-arabinose 1-dehydrogenase-like Zn-dependent alcohol dehydrogenase